MSVPPPDAARLFEAMDRTWPPAGTAVCGPFLLRQGAGGGQRVSSATAIGLWEGPDVIAAERQMAGWRQTPIFQIRPGDQALDTFLGDRGYDVRDPVGLFLGQVRDMVLGAEEDVVVRRHWPPDAQAIALWAGSGIGPGRIAVLERVKGPKAVFVARTDDDISGVGFAALDGDIVMLHALEVRPEARRKGIGGQIVTAIAQWAQDIGAGWFALAVTDQNFAARALYAKKSMSVVTHYHYRRAQQETYD